MIALTIVSPFISSRHDRRLCKPFACRAQVLCGGAYDEQRTELSLAH
jgi:hypothetical protein